MRLRSPRSPWLRVDRLLGEHRIKRDTGAGREIFQTRMTARCHEDHPEQWKKIRRGWPQNPDRPSHPPETAVPLPWIASHLHTGTIGYTVRLLT